MQPDIKNIPQQLGQYLYQQIKEPWLEAQLILNCEDESELECKAHYQTAVDANEQPIAVSDEIIELFSTLFENATTTGRQYGAKSKEVREWMLDPNNYTLDHYSLNRSAGAQLKETYFPPNMIS
ncbi:MULTISPECIES: HNH/ENDO VII family nuclease [Pseudoalteromonas]|uniref:HNH/ENDO VII family nuclease n=1 Tax=Pseudoalteromonas TaxID=53246 RepID=UPI00217617FE|nr:MULTISPECIES: HNH/ENDO VII family nuclease [unclassified Pseudoalteromonas]